MKCIAIPGFFLFLENFLRRTLSSSARAGSIWKIYFSTSSVTTNSATTNIHIIAMYPIDLQTTCRATNAFDVISQ